MHAGIEDVSRLAPTPSDHLFPRRRLDHGRLGDPSSLLSPFGSADKLLTYVYRLSVGTGASLPAAHEDAMAASRWIIDNLNALAPNNGEVVMAGDSAGGNLTLATAARMPDEPRL